MRGQQMNNRQKAKHFKQLYEQMLYSKPLVISKTQRLKHLGVNQLVRKMDMLGEPDLEWFVKDIQRNLVRKLDDVLKEQIIVKDNLPLDCCEYSLDVWVEDREGEDE